MVYLEAHTLPSVHLRLQLSKESSRPNSTNDNDVWETWSSENFWNCQIRNSSWKMKGVNLFDTQILTRDYLKQIISKIRNFELQIEI